MQIFIQFLLLFPIQNHHYYDHSRFPFDWNNPIGYAIVILLQMRFVAVPFRFIGIFMSFGIADFIYAVSMAKDFREDIKSCNETAKQSKLQAMEKFYEALHFTHLRRFEHNTINEEKNFF